MLYIDEIDDYNIRFSNEAEGAGYVKIFRKPLVSVSDEIQGITIYDLKKQEQVLYKYLPANITLDGTVYSTASEFSVQFNIIGSSLNQNWYGVEWLTTDASPDVTRIAERPSAMNLHATLPIHAEMKTALLLDNGTVNYYLKADDWTKKEDGTASNLTGTDGQVMVRIPSAYWQFVTIGNLRQIKICTVQKTGFTFIAGQWVSAYEGAVQRSTLKAASVMSTDADYRGGNNNAALDAAANSLLGKPASSLSRTSMRTYSRNRGAGWEMYNYNAHKIMMWLFVVEFATRNSQKPVNATLTAEGYKQGGLGNGVTDVNSTEWSNFSGYYPFVSCGASNSLGNSTGKVSVIVPDFGGAGVNRTVTVPRYRGIEHPFGHIWKNIDGINIKIQSVAAGNESQVWTSDAPATWNDSNYTGYTNKGLLARKNGYMSDVLFGDSGEFVPKVASGDSITYFCDYFYTSIPASGEEVRTLRLGGAANSGSSAGFGCSAASTSPASADADIGFRLCFLGA